jgi:hypothetical protein
MARAPVYHSVAFTVTNAFARAKIRPVIPEAGEERLRTRPNDAQALTSRGHWTRNIRHSYVGARPHHVGLMRIGLRVARIGLEQRLGLGTDNHHVRTCLDPIVVGLSSVGEYCSSWYG